MICRIIAHRTRDEQQRPVVPFNRGYACASMIIYNGSLWHEHGPNETDMPRRSIQGAFIRRTETPALDWRSRMDPETLTRISQLAKYLLGV